MSHGQHGDIEHASTIPTPTLSKRVRLRQMRPITGTPHPKVSKAVKEEPDFTSGEEDPPTSQDPILSANEFTSSDGELTDAEPEEPEEIETSSSGFFASSSTAIRKSGVKSGFVSDKGRAYLEPLFQKANDTADYSVTSGSDLSETPDDMDRIANIQGMITAHQQRKQKRARNEESSPEKDKGKKIAKEVG